MAVNNSESNYPPPVPPSRRSSEPAQDMQWASGNEPLDSPDRDITEDEATDVSGDFHPSLDDFDLSDVGELMALNIGLDEPPPPAVMDSPPPQLEPTDNPTTQNPHFPAVAETTPEPDHTHHTFSDFDTPPPSNLEDATQTSFATQPEYRPQAETYPTDSDTYISGIPGHQRDVQQQAPNLAYPPHAEYPDPYPSQYHGRYEAATPPPPGSLPITAQTAPKITTSTHGDGPTALLMETLSRSPWMVVGAAVAVLALVATASWVSGGGDEETQGGNELLTTPDERNPGTDEEPTTTEAELAPLSPAAIPPIDQPGLVGLEIDLFDPYTGRGITGKVDLYLNAVSGQICHQFEAEVMDAAGLNARYRAYIHEAVYPKEGPIVVDLGETISAIPQCVMASPIELARFMTAADDFYVAAHSPNRDVLLRGQLSTGATAFDNRDEETKAEQAATAEVNNTTPTTTGPDALFGTADDGAYLVVDAGKVTFEGAVADAATASRLQSAFIPLAGLGVEVVDNLTIEPGAPAPSGRVVVADALLFGSGQDQIDGDPLVLTTLADLLRVNSTWTATITGHTDDVGEWLLNVDLSLRRANNIRGRLAQLGVPAERIRVQGAGPEQPIADNETAEGRARNRRIEISISSGG